MTSAERPLPRSSLAGEVLAGVLGIGVAVACALPPVLHFVLGPLGPMIGGFVAASQCSPAPRAQIVIAVTVGSGLAGVLALAARLIESFAGPSDLPSWFPSHGALLAVVAGVWLYGVALAAVGAALRHAPSRKPSA